jgi:S1-C subfamily serine protease
MSKKAVFSIVLVLGIVSCFVHWNALFRSADAKVDTVSLQSKEQSQKQGANEAAENESSQDQRILREFIDGLGPAKSTTGITGVMGFVIDDIDPGSPAEIVGLKKGDVILNVDRHEVSSLKPIMKMTRKDPGAPVTMIVSRYNPEMNRIEHTKVTMPLAAR